MRALLASAALFLAGCAASAQTAPSPPPVHGVAYVDIAQITKMPQWRTFYAAYDREAAALKATQHVPQLTDTRPIAQHQGQVARNGARDANAALDALRSRVAGYTPELPDANAVRNRIARTYQRQAAAVQQQATQSLAKYRTELNAETASALASYRASLDARVNSAYAARAQQLREKEAAVQIELDRADANQDLVLRVKLQNLKSPQVNRAALRARLNALEARENRALAAVRAKNGSTLATYRAKLVADAGRDYATMRDELQRKAQANWQLRQRISQAQTKAPQQLTLPAASDVTFANGWSSFAGTVDATGSAFTSGADDIAKRFSAIAAMDTDARGSAANEIIALQQDRASLNDEVARAARTFAEHLAAERGLRLVTHPQPGAINLTPAVKQQLATLSP